MSDRLQTLLDQMDIRQVLAEYARGADRVDLALLKGVFWEDANDYHGPRNGSAHDSVEGMITRLPATYRVTTHLLGQICFLQMDARRATTETYFTARHLVTNDEVDWMLSGRYLDLFEKRGETWRILDRYVQYDIITQMGAETDGMPGMIRGARSPQDRSYTLFEGAMS